MSFLSSLFSLNSKLKCSPSHLTEEILKCFWGILAPCFLVLSGEGWGEEVGSKPGSAQGLLPGSVLRDLSCRGSGNPCVVLGTEPQSGSCQASDLPAVFPLAQNVCLLFPFKSPLGVVSSPSQRTKEGEPWIRACQTRGAFWERSQQKGCSTREKGLSKLQS